MATSGPFQGHRIQDIISAVTRTRDIDYSGSPSDCTLDLEDKSLFLKE